MIPLKMSFHHLHFLTIMETDEKVFSFLIQFQSKHKMKMAEKRKKLFNENLLEKLTVNEAETLI